MSSAATVRCDQCGAVALQGEIGQSDGSSCDHYWQPVAARGAQRRQGTAARRAHGRRSSDRRAWDQPAPAWHTVTVGGEIGGAGPPMWAAMCSRCGRVGLPQDYMADAQCIADEHERRQGFRL